MATRLNSRPSQCRECAVENQTQPQAAELVRLVGLVSAMAGRVSACFVQTIRLLDDLGEAGRLGITGFAPEEIDREGEIHALCAGLIGRHQPLTTELRLIMASLKLAAGFARINDATNDIVAVLRVLNEYPPREPEIRLLGLAKLAQTMIERLMTAYPVPHQAQFLRREICNEFRKLEEFLRGRTRELVTIMIADPKTTTRALELMFALRAVEAVGAQVCEMVSHLEALAGIRRQPEMAD